MASNKKSYDNSLFDIEKVLADCKDKRTETEIAEQTSRVLQLADQNIRNFNVIEDNTIKIQPAKRTLRRYTNTQTNWFCSYTDNLQDLQLKQTDFELSEITVVTTHGGAFDTSEFYKLETAFGEKTCRWINFCFPGYDGADERRGNYTGGAKDVSDLLEELLNHLDVGQIVFFGHSFGGFIRNYYVLMYPRRVLALGASAVHTINWNVGLRAWNECFIRPMGLGQKSPQEILQLVNNDDSRKEVCDNINKSFEIMRDMSGLEIQNIETPKLCAQLKYQTIIQHPIELLETFRLINPNIPQFISFGKDDQLIQQSKVIENIEFLQKHSGRAEQRLRETPEIQGILKGIKFDYSKKVFYDNFLFAFEKSGHTPHLKRAREQGATFKIFVTLIDSLRRQNLLPHLNNPTPKF